MACDFHVVIDIAPGQLPLGILVGLERQGPQCGAIERRKQFLAWARQLRKRTGLEGRQEGLEGRVALGQWEEGVVPQPGEQPAFHHLDTDCDCGLIPWFGGTRRDHGKARVASQISIGAIELGFIAVGLDHGRFEIIGDDALRNPAEGRKGPHRRADPVGQTLGPGRLGIGRVGRARDRHQNGRFMHLTAVAVDHWDALAGVIHKELFARAMRLAHDQSQLGGPGPIRLAEPAVLEALWRDGFVFLPQQAQGHARALQLLVHRRPVWDGVGCGPFGREGWKQQPRDGRLIEARG
jgi:hypothetical protein